MRLGRFQLDRYGPFEHLMLPFDPTPGRVNLIVAPNGYGKSVIRRAIGEFLFGIETRTPMAFRFGTERMHLRADITHDQTTRSLVRRKGNGNTLALADGTEIPPQEAQRLLGGADEKLFHDLFGLDTALLRSGGQDLIRSQGRLGQVLFAAGGGMGRVRDLLTELERKRDELGRAASRHKSRPLWSALSNWEQANTDLRRIALRPDGWTVLESNEDQAAQTLKTLLTAQAEDTQERDRLRVIGACRPWLDRLHTAQQTLAEAADSPDLDETFEKRWRDALENGVKSASGAAAASTDLQTARDTRASLGFDPAWIAAASEIGALGDQIAAQAEADLPAVQRELAAEQLKATTLRRDLGWEVAVPLPPATAVKDAQRRLRLHPKLVADAAANSDALAAADRALAATLAELADLPNQDDVAAIADLAGLLRAPGDPAIRLDQARRKRRDAATSLLTALAAIPDCKLAEQALDTTAAPSEATLEAAANALHQAESAHAQATRGLADRLAEIDAEQARLQALEQTAMLPPPDALAQARARRNSLWAQFSALERPPQAAAIALDRAIRDADDIADALIAHGQEVAEAAALRAHLATLQTARAKQAETLTKTAATVAHARATLLEMARTAGGNAADVPGLRSFLRARETAISSRAARDAAATELADLEATLVALGARLAAAMDVPPRTLPELNALLAEADRRIDANRKLVAQRDQLTAQATRQRAARATAAPAAETAARALAEWEAAWRRLAAELLRPEAETPATTADALAQIDDLRNAENAIAEKHTRVCNMQAAIANLTARIARLSPLSPELAALPPIESADAFRRRLHTEQLAAARCADADRRVEQATLKLAQAVNQANTAASSLGALRAAVRADTDEATEAQLQRARSVAEARKNRAEALRELAVQSGGLSIDTLIQRAAQTTAEADAARISEIDANHHARIPMIEAARDAHGAANTLLDQAGIGLDAAEAAQRREAAQAMLARTAEEALILHATHALLQTALDRQAAGADEPLLARIGDVFRTITGGAHAGVRIEETKEGQTMVALEADGLTRKSLSQLSEGTCDQLYLALRIAALEDYAATASALPFIADDILQTFDDPRTAATMRALLKLSERVQVIVLTHHTHVGNLAAQLPDRAVQVIPLDASMAIPA